MTGWHVVVHTEWDYKIEYEVGDETMAKEYAIIGITRGVRFRDKHGVMTYIPPGRIQKIKVVPPEVILSHGEQLLP